MNRVRAYIHVFLILALALANISPACAFISGKTLAEICGADGSVKKVEIDPALLPYLSADGPQEDRSAPRAQKDCAFCFASANIHVLMVSSPAIILPPKNLHYVKLWEADKPLSRPLKAYQSRAPPSLLS